MSDALQPQSNEEAAEQPKKSTATKVRTCVLLVILVLLIGCLVYEFAVARPNWQAASDTIGDWVGKKLRKTQQDVHKALDREPAETRVGTNFLMEKYEWRSGLLIRTHNLYVSYQPHMPGLIERVGSEPPPEWEKATPK